MSDRIEFDLERDLAILRRTPDVLIALLRGLPAEWTDVDEGEGSWSARMVVAHLIHGEHSDWIPRVKLILDPSSDHRFEPFVRDGNAAAATAATMDGLLDDFAVARAQSLRELAAMGIGADAMDLPGIHPEFGHVTLRQLLATWIAHDLGHLVQVNRVMARRLRADVGPWTNYMSVMR